MELLLLMISLTTKSAKCTLFIIWSRTGRNDIDDILPASLDA